MTTYNYTAEFFWRLAVAHDPRELMQLELHPGLNCGLYRCKYCFGHGQALNPGRHLAAEEYEVIAESLGRLRPTVIVSGVATDPLTHPDAAGVLRAFRRRGFSLGLYAKGHNLNEDVRQALVDGPGECFVTISVDAGTQEDYVRVHDMAPTSNAKLASASSFESILANLRAMYALKHRVKPELKLRVSILVFEGMARPGKLAQAVHLLEQDVDLIRVAFAQDRNDGHRHEALPAGRARLLASFVEEFAGHPKVKILTNTHSPTRSTSFARCVVQRTQVTIDKSGNVFPCPQVALAPYQNLMIGNVRELPLPVILASDRRKEMFGADVDTVMRCRICDRKDESINAAVAGNVDAFNDFAPVAAEAPREPAPTPIVFMRR